MKNESGNERKKKHNHQHHTHTNTHTYSDTHTHTHTPTLTQTHTLTHKHTYKHAQTHSDCYTHTLSSSPYTLYAQRSCSLGELLKKPFAANVFMLKGSPSLPPSLSLFHPSLFSLRVLFAT